MQRSEVEPKENTMDDEYERLVSEFEAPIVVECESTCRGLEGI